VNNLIEHGPDDNLSGDNQISPPVLDSVLKYCKSLMNLVYYSKMLHDSGLKCLVKKSDFGVFDSISRPVDRQGWWGGHLGHGQDAPPC
jgi:hypothetical protein